MNTTKRIAEQLVTEALIAGLSPIEVATNAGFTGVRGYWIRRHVARFVAQIKAGDIRCDAERDADAATYVASLDRFGEYAVEKGRFGSRNRNGYRVYKLGASPLAWNATVVYSRELPAGAGAKEAVELVASRRSLTA